MKQIIVNEQDEIIGYKLRIEITSQDIYRVSALWIENSRGEVLLAQRGFLKRNSPGKWWPAVAGTVDEGENYEDNIYKEALEEIGLSGCIFSPEEKLRVQWRYHYFCQWFSLVLDKDISEFSKEEGQVESLRWTTKEELKNLIEICPEIFTDNFANYIKKRLN